LGGILQNVHRGKNTRKILLEGKELLGGFFIRENPSGLFSIITQKKELTFRKGIPLKLLLKRQGNLARK